MDKRQLDAIKEARQQKYLDNCKKRLSDIAEKKMKTTFIGAIAKFEEEFGELWSDEDGADEDQKYWADKWQLVRTEILNNGNNQLRALMNEISNHVVSWNRYTMNFKVI